MRVVSVTYNAKPSQHDPVKWLERIGFYNGILSKLSTHCEVINIDLIGWEGELSRDGVRHLFLRHRSSFIEVNSVIKKLSPDIVLVHGFLFPLAVIHLGIIRSKGTRIILQHHAEMLFNGPKRYLFRMADRYTAAYFFATHNMAEEWTRARLISSPDKIFELPEGSSVFSTTNPAPKNMNEFLWVGRLNDNKDPLTVAAAFADHAQVNPAVTLYMIYQEDTLLEKLGAVIEAKNATGNIVLVGKLPHRQMQEWYERAAFIISTSYYEGCSISVLEAMSCGCIPIVTKIPSFALHTANGSIGLQFEPGNKEALLNCLSKTNEMNVDLEKERVQRYFKTHLSFDAIAKKMNDCFQSIERS